MASTRNVIETPRRDDRNRPPTGERSAAARLASFLSPDRTLQMVDASGQVMDVPASLTEVIRKSAELLAAGQTVTVLADDKFLTTQQAATLLNMSRQYLVRLIEGGHVPAVKVGAHRRLRIADVEAFKVRRDTERAAALDVLVALSEEIGGYDLSNATS